MADLTIPTKTKGAQTTHEEFNSIVVAINSKAEKETVAEIQTDITDLETDVLAINTELAEKEAEIVALQSDKADRRSNFLIAAIGDSRMANSVQKQSTSPLRVHWSNQGILTWFMFLTHQKFNLPYNYNFAVSGNTTTQILATVPSVLALNPKPKYCIVLGGTNDIGGIPIATTKSNLIAIAEQLIAGGVTPIFISDIPRLTSTWSSTYAKLHQNLNNWLRRWCRDNGFALADAYNKMIIPSTGEPLSGYFIDGIHQTSLASHVIGNELKNVFNSIGAEPRWDSRMQSVLDVYDSVNNPTGNIFGSIGLLLGTSGTNTGSGASGTVATGWNNRVISGTCTSVASKESPRVDGVMGDAQILTISATTASVIRFSNITPISVGASTYSPGDKIYGEVDIEVQAGSVGLQYTDLMFFEIDGGSATLSSSQGFKSVDSTMTYPTSLLQGRIRTVPFVAEAGSSQIIFRIEIGLLAGGSATIKIGNAVIRKVIPGDYTII